MKTDQTPIVDGTTARIANAGFIGAVLAMRSRCR